MRLVCIQNIILSFLVIVLLAVSHPYLLISTLMPSFRVLLIIDEEDQDEDIVLILNGEDQTESGNTAYQEESKRDFGRKGMKFKLKLTTIFQQFAVTAFFYSSLVTFVTYHESILEPTTTDIFHPPPALI